MISLLWSTVTAVGFMAAGFLLRDGEFRLAVMAAFSTWVWLMFPKVPMWIIGTMIRKFRGERTPKATASGRVG